MADDISGFALEITLAVTLIYLLASYYELKRTNIGSTTCNTKLPITTFNA
jgi:hypothetical protein